MPSIAQTLGAEQNHLQRKQKKTWFCEVFVLGKVQRGKNPQVNRKVSGGGERWEEVKVWDGQYWGSWEGRNRKEVSVTGDNKH